MIIDATFWVAISFLIFLGILIYFKIPQKINLIFVESINKIKNEISEAEKLKNEAKNILSEHEKKISNSKKETRLMLDKAQEDAEKTVLKMNDELHAQIENRKIDIEDRIKQMKKQAFKDIKNASIKIAINSVEKLLKNSLDKTKLDKIYLSSIEETKLALKKKSS
ncbi:MAG: F-type H+-transporting ATPase subunit b [Pelagibacterales bacterium]|jgi:F-type H+-transporting ATPase subunit b|nr:F-type H+-transporting ATPase subunit b [Pelagibacterales bacterium]